MRACHILLGRPWLYDRRVHYDGFRNTYSFMFEGKKLQLQPLKLHDFDMPKEENRVLTMRPFTEACQERGFLLH
jgi:hypothetical protein